MKNYNLKACKGRANCTGFWEVTKKGRRRVSLKMRRLLISNKLFAIIILQMSSNKPTSGARAVDNFFLFEH